MPNLVNRLATVADMILPGKPVADIGADHGQLSIYLIEKQIVPRVIIGELSDGPFARACRAVQNSTVEDEIELRQGNGLQVLKFKEVSTVVLAGMGGDTIIDILAHDWAKAASFQRFVFQPMSKAEVLRQRLASRGWVIEEERLVLENGKIFLIMASSPANCPYPLTDLEIEIGPLILKANDKLTRSFIQGYLRKYNRIYAELMRSSLHRNHLLIDDYRGKIERLEEILGASQG